MLSSNYIEYLQHFGQTVTMAELHARSEAADLISLRHDVDHNLDMALEMSYWEYRQGIRATYFVLPGAEYWLDQRLLDKCLQIQDFGHEVGLHLNVISEWFKKEMTDPGRRLSEILVNLRSAGLRINGTATHGDPLCYEKQFINYWIFKELRPEQPEGSESGLSAEGIQSDEGQFSINYPKNHVLRRDDGRRLPLWSVNMQELGLDYHAVHVPHDHYYTDSGGSWKRSPDPLTRELSTGRHQVLIHPEYWRGSQKIFFFLSTARSGSKWLATILDQATPLLARHEFSLNHRYSGHNLIHEHLTGPGFVSLDQDRDKAGRLMLDARTWVEEQGLDYVEANVYLERFLPQMREIFPDAVLVHLYRNPADVVRSLINRNWYDTPGDNRHPVIDVDNWDVLSQFDKVCWYVRAVNENLMPLQAKICFEQMVSDPSRLEKSLRELGIPFYPRLARETFSRKINANSEDAFPKYAKWPDKLKKIFKPICGGLMQRLGYQNGISGLLHRFKGKLFPGPGGAGQGNSFARLTARPAAHSAPELLSDMDFTSLDAMPGISYKSCEVSLNQFGLKIIPTPEVHSFILLGGGEWAGLDDGAGWEPRPAHFYQGKIEVQISMAGSTRLFCLIYDQEGKLAERRLLQVLKAEKKEYTFSFRVRSNAVRFNLALHMSRNDLPDELIISSFELWMHALEG